MYTLEVPGRVPTLNQVYSSNNYHQRNNWRDEWKDTFGKYLLASDVPDQLEEPIKIKITQYTVRKRDVDNCVMANKFFADTLESMGYIGGDGPEVLVESAMAWGKATSGYDSEYMLIEIEEGV